MSYSNPTKPAEIEAYKLRFILRQKALPVSFHHKGEGFSEDLLSATTVESVFDSAGQEVLLVHFPKEIGVTALAESGIKLAGLFRTNHIGMCSSHDFAVAADSFRILADKDIAAPLEDLINTPFYLASVIQKEASGVKRLPTCLEQGDMVRVLSISGNNAIIKLRDDVSASLMNLYGFTDIWAGKNIEFGAAFSVSLVSLVDGCEKAIQKLKLQDEDKNNLGLLASKMLGTNISVIAYNMICDGVIGVGMDANERYSAELKKFEEMLKNSNVNFKHFNLGTGYV